jgi:spore maturation protein CgeB
MISTLFESNHEYIRQHPEKFAIRPGHCRFSREYRLVPSKEDVPGIELLQTDGKKTTLVSPYYPRKEAQKKTDALPDNTETLIVFGLGYHIEYIGKRFPQREIIVIEPDKHLCNLLLGVIDLTAWSEHTRLIVGYEDFEVPTFLGKKEGVPEVFETRAVPGYFNLLAKRLRKEPVFDLSDRWRYRKFFAQKVRVLYIDSGYVLTKECLWAIEKLGHQYRYIHIDHDNYDYEAFIRGFMQEIATFKPDFVLTVNHLGFDREGRLTELLSTMEIPYVSWYVDSPTVILSSGRQNISPWCNLFVWDRDYIADVKAHGYYHADYLPLATLSDLFRPIPLPEAHDVGFVGSSMVYSTHKNLRSFVFRQDLLTLVDTTARAFLELDSRYVGDAIARLEANGVRFGFDTTDQRDDFEAAVLWRSTQIYRKSGILQLAPFYPTIFGDPNWDNVLDNRFRIEREVMYYDGLAELYNQCRINFNMTSRQMKNAVNQRVFDVPACGRFLLTDYKSQLDEIFEPGEVVCFREIGEISDLVRFYLTHDTERNEIARRGRERILQKDTYIHRLREMIDIMRKRYGSQ